MGIIIGILLVIFVLVAILLVLLILSQDDGTDGAGILFGSAASQQYGAKKGNIITRTTGILATIFMVVAFGLSFLFQVSNKETDLDIQGPENSDFQIEWWNTDSVDEDGDIIPLENTTSSENTVEDTTVENESTSISSEQEPVDASDSVETTAPTSNNE